MTSAAPGRTGGSPALEARLRVLLPLGVGVVALVGWQLLVTVGGVSDYLLPSPAAIVGEVVEFWPAISSAALVTGANALVGLVVVSGLLSGYQHYLLQRMGEGIVLSSRRTLVRRILRLPISEFDTRRTGDLVSRVGSDTTLLRAVLTQGVVESIGGALTFVGALIAMAILDPVLLLITVAVVAVAVVTVVTLSARIRPAVKEAQKKVGDLAAAVERSISAIRTVRASNATDRELAAIDRDAYGAWEQGIKVARGRYVMFLDSDDTLEPHACRNMVEAADRTGAAAARRRLLRSQRPISGQEHHHHDERSVATSPVIHFSSPASPWHVT